MLTLQSPDLLDLLCSHVSMGGSPIDFCVTHSIRYDYLIKFLYDDKACQNRYNAALDARTEWFIQRVLLEINRLSTSDIREAYNPDGTFKDIKDLPPDLAACIASIETEELYEGTGLQRIWIGYTKKIKLWDKNSALDKLGKIMAMFIERHDHVVRGNVTVMGDITVSEAEGQPPKPLRFNLGSTN